MAFSTYTGRLIRCFADRVDSEPEFRLVFMSLALVTCGIGMFLFGYTMAIGANAALCSFLQGVMMVGVLIGIFSTLSYALDAFRSQSNEIFIMNMLFKVGFDAGGLVRALLTRYATELHVLRTLQLRKQLGGRKGSRTDHVCVRWHVNLHMLARNTGLYLREENAQLVGAT